jgi:GGDEF domain-containing protein
LQRTVRLANAHALGYGTVVSDRVDTLLKAMFPMVSPAEATEALVDAEAHRRGQPDRISGAFHALALTQGTLLKEEYDLSTHGHGEWVLGAVLADVRELTVINMHHGFPEGDRVLEATFEALKSVAPGAKVVRTHADGFAALLGPTADQRVDEALGHRAREALSKVTALDQPVAFTTGLLELTVTQPSHPQLLGVLAWAECERALAIARREPFTSVMTRRIALDGAVPLGPR